LNFGKNSCFHKTNHPGFAPSVRQPSPLAKTNGKPAKRIVRNLGVKRAGGNKTNHPVFPHALPSIPSMSWRVVLSSSEGSRGRSNLGGPFCLSEWSQAERRISEIPRLRPRVTTPMSLRGTGCRSNLGGAEIATSPPAPHNDKTSRQCVTNHMKKGTDLHNVLFCCILYV
jgi:hypothetical protein